MKSVASPVVVRAEVLSPLSPVEAGNGAWAVATPRRASKTASCKNLKAWRSLASIGGVDDATRVSRSAR